MLAGSTPHEIRERSGKVCHIVGYGGGFIMSTDIGEMERCNPELIEVWIDDTRGFGS